MAYRKSFRKRGGKYRPGRRGKRGGRRRGKSRRSVMTSSRGGVRM